MVPRAARLAKRAGPSCVANAETWWNNNQGETPCDVYQSILDKCGFTAPPITSGDSYYPILSAQECMCNTITYNLGSACIDCQRGASDQGILVSQYISGGDGCPNMSNDLPATVTPTNDIPFWALLDTSTQFWSYDAAREIALNQTTTATSSQPSSTDANTSTDSFSTMSATPTLTPTETPTTSPGAAPVTSGHKSTNAGAIGGGVAGGVVALLLVIGLLLLWRRRRARQSQGGGMVMGAANDDGGRNPSASSESSLTESGKGVGVSSHYTPHSQMQQLHHNGSGVVVGSYSSASALSTPVDAPPVPSVPREYATPTPARSLAASPTPSQPVSAANKVKRVPVRYSEDELAQAEQAEIEARKASGQQ